jgi:hypothetical protein
MSLNPRTWLVLVGALLAVRCGGGTIDPGLYDSKARDKRVTWPDGPRRDAARDTSVRVDLTTKAGDPCTSGKCGANLICMANSCLKMCTAPKAGCNHKESVCGANEACMWGSDFTDACYPASANYLQACDYSKGIYCVGGTLCVKVDNNAPKCLKVCPGGTGCPSGVPCGQTTTGCQICIQ